MPWTRPSKITTGHRVLHQTLNFKIKKNQDSSELDMIDSLDGWWPPEKLVQERVRLLNYPGGSNRWSNHGPLKI